MVGIRKEVRIGLVGYKFMGKAHSHAYQSLSTFFQFGVKPVKQAFVEEMKRESGKRQRNTAGIVMKPIGGN